MKEFKLSPDEAKSLEQTLDPKPKQSDIPAPDKPKAPEGEVQNPQASDSALAIHKTIPVPESLARFKKAHKPRKEKNIKEVPKNERIQNDERPARGRRSSGDAGNGPGRGTGLVLPIDLFLGREPRD